MRKAHLAIVAWLLGGVACAHQPRPYTFTVAERQGAIDVLADTLAANGLYDIAIDRDRGTLTTRWFDTGYRYRSVKDIDDGPHIKYSTNVFLRYRVALGRDDGRQTVTLETDVQRCAPLDAVVTESGVRGTCLPMDVLPPTYQKQADELGQKLRSALEAKAAS